MEEKHHHKHHMDKNLKHSLLMVLLLISCAALFCVGVLLFKGPQSALEFLGGYLIEFSLSMDNLFVFISIFTAFSVPLQYQHRCLTWGIICAIIMRFIFISLGLTIVEKFSWVLYIFGGVLIISGVRMFRGHEENKDAKNSFGMKVLGKIMPISNEYDGQKFITKIDGKRHATPLLAVLFVIEFSDILFAIDSVPAVFSVSTDIFIVYTSNIFAILGLRQLYFVLEHLQSRFCYVKYGVALILTFTGIKLLLLVFDFHISIPVSISIIFSILVLSVVLSMIVTKKQQQKGEGCGAEKEAARLKAAAAAEKVLAAAEAARKQHEAEQAQPEQAQPEQAQPEQAQPEQAQPEQDISDKQ